MLTEMICAVAVLMTVRHVRQFMQQFLEEHAELAAQVLFLSVKVRELRELNTKLRVQNQYFRYETAAARRTVAIYQNERRRFWCVLGRRYIAARMTAETASSMLS